MLFTTSEETQIFCLRLSVDEDGVQSAGAAVPIMDLAKVCIDFNDGEEIIGGLVSALKWDPKGERLAVSFKESNFIALFVTRVSVNGINLSPIGFVQGEHGQEPSCMEFTKNFSNGALLSIVWSDGRFQYFPMLFVPNSDKNGLLAVNSPGNVEFHPKIFSSPAQ